MLYAAIAMNLNIAPAYAALARDVFTIIRVQYSVQRPISKPQPARIRSSNGATPSLSSIPHSRIIRKPRCELEQVLIRYGEPSGSHKKTTRRTELKELYQRLGPPLELVVDTQVVRAKQ